MAKKNNLFWKKAGVILSVVVLGAGIVAGFVTNSGEIKDNAKEITDHETRIRTVETAVTEQRKDVVYIKEALVRIEGKL